MSPRFESFEAARARLAGWNVSLVKFLKTVFGDVAWTPPAWVATLRAREQALRARAAANPKVFQRNAAIAVAGIVTLFVAVQLWRHRPRAVRTDFSVTTPPATDLTVDNPKPEPLRVRFEGSVAPLATVGKVLNTGIDISPRIAGTWRWVGDRELEFAPAEDRSPRGLHRRSSTRTRSIPISNAWSSSSRSATQWIPRRSPGRSPSRWKARAADCFKDSSRCRSPWPRTRSA